MMQDIPINTSDVYKFLVLLKLLKLEQSITTIPMYMLYTL